MIFSRARGVPDQLFRKETPPVLRDWSGPALLGVELDLDGASAKDSPGRALIYTGIIMKPAEVLRRFEDDQIRASAPDYEAGLQIFEALWREAVELGTLPLEDPLDGIEVDVHLAEMLRV